jgi:uncharacterized protein YoxC
MTVRGLTVRRRIMSNMPNENESANDFVESADKKIKEVKRVVGFTLPESTDGQRSNDEAKLQIDEARISKIETDINAMRQAINNLAQALSDIAQATIKNSDSISKNSDSILKVSNGLLRLSTLARTLHGFPQTSEPDIK